MRVRLSAWDPPLLYRGFRKKRVFSENTGNETRIQAFDPTCVMKPGHFQQILDAGISTRPFQACINSFKHSTCCCTFFFNNAHVYYVTEYYWVYVPFLQNFYQAPTLTQRNVGLFGVSFFKSRVLKKEEHKFKKKNRSVSCFDPGLKRSGLCMLRGSGDHDFSLPVESRSSVNW